MCWCVFVRIGYCYYEVSCNSHHLTVNFAVKLRLQKECLNGVESASGLVEAEDPDFRSDAGSCDAPLFSRYA